MDALPDTDPATDDRACYEPAEILASLTRQSDLVGISEPLPTRLDLSDITRLPQLFQPRSISENHITDLVRAIERFGALDPVTVIRIGQQFILIDGHHRLEAYQRAKQTSAIPVSYFTGTPEEAVLEAGEANSKAKLPMMPQERQDHAWRLVLLDRHSKSQISRASGTSSTQVANMRKVRRELAASAYDHEHWWQARKAAQGPEDEISDDDREQWKADMAEDFANRLAREFSTKLADRPEIAAMALSAYFGRRLPEVVRELRDYLRDQEDEESEF